MCFLINYQFNQQTLLTQRMPRNYSCLDTILLSTHQLVVLPNRQSHSVQGILGGDENQKVCSLCSDNHLRVEYCVLVGFKFDGGKKMTFLSQIFLQTSFPHQELNLLCTLFLSILLFCHDLILLSCFALLNTTELMSQ